jgi:hypothetical protein
MSRSKAEGFYPRTRCHTVSYGTTTRKPQKNVRPRRCKDRGRAHSRLGRVSGRPEDRRWISVAFAGPGYFETLGTPLLAPREFRFEDSEHPMVAVINQRMARYYFPGADPIGKHITLDHRTRDPTARTYEVVGVVGNVNYYEIRETPLRIVYLPAFHDARVPADTGLIPVNPSVVSGAKGLASSGLRDRDYSPFRKAAASSSASRASSSCDAHVCQT